MIISSVSELISIAYSMGKSVIIAIDGPCGSGKTTVSDVIASSGTECNIFHTDDFFLPPEKRTSQRLSETGGNFDRERFLEDLLIPLREGKVFDYRPFDCCTMSLKEPVKVLPRRINIIEGVYSMHPELESFYDISVYADTDECIRRERLIKREGVQKAQIYFERWIPIENRYFEEFRIKDRCGYIIDLSERNSLL